MEFTAEEWVAFAVAAGIGVAAVLLTFFVLLLLVQCRIAPRVAEASPDPPSMTRTSTMYNEEERV